MATIHILTQYVWPDAAPTGLYAEQLAERLHRDGFDVRLVGGRGGYRALHRPKPQAEIVYLAHRQGRRGNLQQTFVEYAAVTRAFRGYIDRSVRTHDVVIVSSAPPNTIGLAKAIHRRGARAVYWLQDYYPELIRGFARVSGAAASSLPVFLGSPTGEVGSGGEDRRQPRRPESQRSRHPKLADDGLC